MFIVSLRFLKPKRTNQKWTVQNSMIIEQSKGYIICRINKKNRMKNKNIQINLRNANKALIF